MGTDSKYMEKRSIVRSLFGSKCLDVFLPLESVGVLSYEETLTKLHQCQAFIADLSMERPSVYFELGLASAFGKPIYLLASEGTKIHQSGAHQILTYSGINEYKEVLLSITDAIQKNVLTNQ